MAQAVPVNLFRGLFGGFVGICRRESLASQRDALLWTARFFSLHGRLNNSVSCLTSEMPSRFVKVIDDGSRDAERHAELRFETCQRTIMNEEPWSDRVDFNVDGVDVIGRKTSRNF
jgi:hypothetical protein